MIVSWRRIYDNHVSCRANEGKLDTLCIQRRSQDRVYYYIKEVIKKLKRCTAVCLHALAGEPSLLLLGCASRDRREGIGRNGSCRDRSCKFSREEFVQIAGMRRRGHICGLSGSAVSIWGLWSTAICGRVGQHLGSSLVFRASEYRTRPPGLPQGDYVHRQKFWVRACIGKRRT